MILKFLKSKKKSKISTFSLEKSISSSKIFTWKNRFFNWNFRFLKNQIFFQKIKIFKIKNLQDEKIFFIQIFFCIKVCISTIQKTHLEHPGMCLGDASRLIRKKRSFFALYEDLCEKTLLFGKNQGVRH